MPSIPIIMPQLGESIAEATILNLLVKVGDRVETNQDILEVETSKATMNVASPCPGHVEKWTIQLNESYPVGAVLGYLLASTEDAARLGLDAPAPEKNGEEGEIGPGASSTVHGETAPTGVKPTVRGLPVCFDALLKHRKTCNPKPGPALYALRALAIALSENSAPAGRLIGNKIVHPSAIDVGFAVEAEDGVLVPVIRSAESRPLKDLVARYNELIELAHQRKLPAD